MKPIGDVTQNMTTFRTPYPSQFDMPDVLDIQCWADLLFLLAIINLITLVTKIARMYSTLLPYLYFENRIE
jgi:hypothetical protein